MMNIFPRFQESVNTLSTMKTRLEENAFHFIYSTEGRKSGPGDA